MTTQIAIDALPNRRPKGETLADEIARASSPTNHTGTERTQVNMSQHGTRIDGPSEGQTVAHTPGPPQDSPNVEDPDSWRTKNPNRLPGLAFTTPDQSFPGPWTHLQNAAWSTANTTLNLSSSGLQSTPAKSAQPRYDAVNTSPSIPNEPQSHSDDDHDAGSTTPQQAMFNAEPAYLLSESEGDEASPPNEYETFKFRENMWWIQDDDRKLISPGRHVKLAKCASDYLAGYMKSSKLAIEFMPRGRYEEMYFYALEIAAKDYVMRRRNRMKSITSRSTSPESIQSPGVQATPDPIDAAVDSLSAPKQENETQSSFEQRHAAAERVRHVSGQRPPMPTNEAETTSYGTVPQQGGNTPPATPTGEQNKSTINDRGNRTESSPRVTIQVPQCPQ
ncbi:hypothetical protein BDZ94DRAFT_1312705 [Collybia nuda]|uniref:Uncharacterized protein n=1 Tax=Collybia nuda TaxID=64659 RepID=A0A9P5XXW8_9AGAR|nr:hypothetical protein BDZ94DRAFT_1312705 [Collybia nuda]